MNPFAALTAIACLLASLALSGCNTVKKSAEDLSGAANGGVKTATVAVGNAAEATGNAAEKTIEGAAEAPALVVPVGFYVEELGPDGRIYVFGSAEEHAAFKSGKVGDLWVSATSAGPNRETVKFQVSKDEPGMPDRLKARFNAAHGLNL